MFKRPRSPRFAVAITLALIGVAAGSLITTSAAGVRLGFVETVKEFFGAALPNHSQTVPAGDAHTAESMFLAACAFTSNVTTSGNWSAAGSWTAVGTGCSSYPGQTFAGDTVAIVNGDTITLDISPANSVSSLTIDAPTSTTGVTFSGTNSLTVTGAVTLNAPTSDSTGSVAVGAGTLTAGSFSIIGGSGTRISQVSISTGIINSTGNIAFSGAASNARFTFTGSGTVNVGGNFTGGTFAASTGTVNYNAAGAQTVGGYTYNNLELSGSGTKSASSGTTVSSTFTIGAGTTFNVLGFTTTISGGAALVVNGILDFSNATGMIRSGASGTSTLTMGSAGLIKTLDATGLGPVANGSFETQSGGTWDVSSISNNGTVEYLRNTTSAQTITDRDYNNLTITGSAFNKNWALGAARTINGNLLINTSAPLIFSGLGPVNIKGNWTNNGTFTPGTDSTVAFTGAAAQSIGGTSTTGFKNLTINNTSTGVTLSAPVTTNSSGTLTLTDGNVTTTTTNLLTVTNTAVGAIAGTPANGYINGPIARAVTTNAGPYVFPTGKAGYNPFEMVNVTGSPTVRAEVFDGNSGGTAGSGVFSLNTNHYWQGVVTSGTLTSTQVRLNDSTAAAGNIVAKADPGPGGAYNSQGGTAVAGVSVLSNAISSFSHFMIGTTDTTPPTVNFDLQSASDSGTADSDNTTNAAGLVFDALFSEAITGFLPGDLSNVGTATGCSFAIGPNSCLLYTSPSPRD